jgi:hypothetical protein
VRRARVGDYFRFTRFRGKELDEPCWTVVTSITGTMGRCAILLKGSADYQGIAVTFDLDIRDSTMSNRELVFPEDAPDEVCVEEARRALTR